MPRHLQISLKIMPWVLGMFLIFSIMQVEKRFFPIAQNFQYTKLQRNVIRIEAEGYYTPIRDCEFVGGKYTAIDREGQKINLTSQQISRLTSKYLPAGVQDIGEWSILYEPEFDFQTIQFTGYYKCHPFWINEEKLAVFDAPIPLIESGKINDDQFNANLLLNKLPPM